MDKSFHKSFETKVLVLTNVYNSWEKIVKQRRQVYSNRINGKSYPPKTNDCNECLRNKKLKGHLEQIPTRNKHHKRKAFDKNFKNAK